MGYVNYTIEKKNKKFTPAVVVIVFITVYFLCFHKEYREVQNPLSLSLLPSVH